METDNRQYTPTEEDKALIQGYLDLANLFLDGYREVGQAIVNGYAHIALDAMRLARVDTVEFKRHTGLLERAERTESSVLFVTKDGLRLRLYRECILQPSLAIDYTYELLKELGLYEEYKPQQEETNV